MKKRRVVVTGVGTINPVGKNVNETWDGLLNGKSGIARITNFNTDEYQSQIAGEVKDYNPKDYFSRKKAKKLDIYSQYGLIAADEAVKDSQILDNYNPDKAGVITGVGIGGILTLEKQNERLLKRGPRRVSPFFVPKMISDIAAANISIKYNFKGINFNVVSACASANHAIGTAFRSIQFGDADVIVTGGTEASVTPLSVAGFCSMKALSTRNNDPQKASRPFDAERDGFVMAEGAGFLILEELEHALARNAKIYAELSGYGMTADAFHITAPAEGGEGGVRAMKMALEDSNKKPEDIDYFNAHGTSTPLNDKNETMSIKTVFGEYSKKLKISSTKSMVGHMLGAAGGIEAIVSCKTIQDNKIHPTINLANPDPECDLDYTTDNFIEKEVDIVMSNSLGFGGHNGVLIFEKYK